VTAPDTSLLPEFSLQGYLRAHLEDTDILVFSPRVPDAWRRRKLPERPDRSFANRVGPQLWPSRSPTTSALVVDWDDESDLPVSRPIPSEAVSDVVRVLSRSVLVRGRWIQWLVTGLMHVLSTGADRATSDGLVPIDVVRAVDGMLWNAYTAVWEPDELLRVAYAAARVIAPHVKNHGYLAQRAALLAERIVLVRASAESEAVDVGTIGETRLKLLEDHLRSGTPMAPPQDRLREAPLGREIGRIQVIDGAPPRAKLAAVWAAAIGADDGGGFVAGVEADGRRLPVAWSRGAPELTLATFALMLCDGVWVRDA
jgi:hypothetical protein